jgi:nucleotide-binding universal stress UspA family protein
MKRRRRRKRIAQIFIISLSLVALAVVAGLTYFEMKPMVANVVTIEAGTPSVDVAEFILDKDRSGSFVTDIASLNLNAPGIYEVQIKIKNKIHTSNLEVVDTIAPVGEPVEVTALMNEELRASDFVNNIVDATDVEVSFISEPDTTTPGDKVVKVALEDAGKNIKIIESKLTILDVRSTIQVEAGGVLDVKPEDFVDNDNISIRILSDISGLDISQPTVHTIQIEVDGRVLDSYIEVVDTTPPTATPVNKEAWKGDTVSPADFVTDINDISAYTVSFGSKPDFEAVGSQEVTIIVEDIYKNRTELRPILTIKEDTEPPVFYGIKDFNVFEGFTVSYRKGVSVKDNRDSDVSFQIDSSKVNLNKAGTYKVYYSAKDSAGNTATEVATVTVDPFEVTEEMLYAKVDPVLDKITKKGMTKREIAYEIYKWVKNHVGYTGTSDKSDWMKEAYRGIVNGLGDCFTYYAVSEAFLTRAGIDNMKVTRVGGKTQHFWNLVNCGDGWYHFDTCPNKDKMETFMLTDAQVEAYTKKRGNNYYNFDKSLYPATPEN